MAKHPSEGRVRLKTLWPLFLISVISGCLSDSTIRQRVSDALSTSSIGSMLFSKSKIGCAYAEFEYIGDRTLPKSQTRRTGELGAYWAEVSSIADLDVTVFADRGNRLDMMGQVLLTAKNCAPDLKAFYRVVGETPGFVSTDVEGEEFILIPLDASLPLVFLAGQI
jgi:hypothetical protein